MVSSDSDDDDSGAAFVEELAAYKQLYIKEYGKCFIFKGPSNAGSGKEISADTPLRTLCPS